MTQIYHPYYIWEDYLAGMWDCAPKGSESRLLDEAIRFTGNADEYGAWMMKVAKEWPIACEHNLTNLSQNRRAWIGHSACCMAIKCPEYITRKAWGFLTDQQRIDANMKADLAIMYWEESVYSGIKNAILMF